MNTNIINKNNRMEEWLKNNTLTVKSSLYIIVLNVCDVCNRSCSFCPRGCGYKPPHKNPYMSVKTLEILCKQLGKDFSGRFSMSGFGEPFLHPHIKQLQETIMENCPNSTIYITTNGDYFERDKVIDNLWKIDFSIYSDNHLKTIETKVKDLDIPHTLKCQYLQSFTNFNNRAGNVPIKYEPRTNCCNIPMYRMNMDLNGDFLICCSDWKRELILGNVYKDDVYDVWENRLKEQRILLMHDKRKLCKLCQKCDTIGNLNGDEFKEFWRKYYNV